MDCLPILVLKVGQGQILKVKVKGQYLEWPEDAWGQVLISWELVKNMKKIFFK